LHLYEMKTIIFMGDSRERIREFSEAAQRCGRFKQIGG